MSFGIITFWRGKEPHNGLSKMHFLACLSHLWGVPFGEHFCVPSLTILTLLRATRTGRTDWGLSVFHKHCGRERFPMNKYPNLNWRSSDPLSNRVNILLFSLQYGNSCLHFVCALSKIPQDCTKVLANRKSSNWYAVGFTLYKVFFKSISDQKIWGLKRKKKLILCHQFNQKMEQNL